MPPSLTTMQVSLPVRRYSLAGGFWTRLGGAAAFPALLQSPGFRLWFSLFVSVIYLFLSGFCFWGCPRRHAFARRHVIKTVGHELHDSRQAPEERHVYSHERRSSQPSSVGAAYGTSSSRQVCTHAAPPELGWLLGRSWL